MMKKASVNEAIFEQMANGVDWGQATFWETLLSHEGLEPFEKRTVKCSLKREVGPRRIDYFDLVEEE